MVTADLPSRPCSGTMFFGVLGPLRVDRAGVSILCGGLKQRAVLALLIVNANRPLPVERMIDELWGDDTPPTALATLQAYVSNLRRLLEPDRPARGRSTLIVSRDGAYELAIEPDRIDAQRFERLAADGERCRGRDPVAALPLLAEALGLWRGPALAEFAAYDFAAAEINRLDELRIAAVESRIEAEMAVGEGPEPIAELEQLVSEHPLRERLWGQLMRAYYRSGRQAEALRAYRRCEQVLVEELGIVPSSELRALEQAVLDQHPGLVARRAVRTGPVPATNGRVSEIIGRAAEMRRFRDAVDRAREGSGTVMLIDGESGIGKTRLLEAMKQCAGEFGCPTALARCVEVGGSPPFWPWAQIVRALGPEEVAAAAGPYATVLTSVLPRSTTERPETPDSGEQRYQLADGLVAAMRTLGSDEPVVVLIDDLYCADPDSLSVLALVGAQLANEPVVLVGTRRSKRTTVDQLPVDVLVQLARFEWCERIHLGPLEQREVGELVERVVGNEVATDVIDAIHVRAEGNAFCTVELARLLNDDQNRAGDVRADQLPVPETIREVVDFRLRGLPRDAIGLLRAASLAGRTFDMSVVADALGLPVATALDLTDLAIEEGIIEEVDPAGSYRFSHLLVNETIAARLGALRRAELHHRLATVLEGRADSDRYWHEIAHHRSEAVSMTGPDPAIEALARAGRTAAAVNALELADQLFARRHELVLSSPLSPNRDRSELESLLDHSVVWTWRDGYQSEQMQIAAHRMLDLTDAAGPEAMLDSTTETGVRHGVLPALQAQCSFEIVAGNVVAAEQVARTMLAVSAVSRHPYVTAVAHINAAVAAIHNGRIADALAHGDAVNEVLADIDSDVTGEAMLPLGQQGLVVTHLGFHAWALLMAGRRADATQVLGEARLVADRCGHAFTRTFHATIECLVATIDGSSRWALDVIDWETRPGRTERFEFLDTSLDLYRAWAVGRDTDPGAGAASVRSAMARLSDRGARVVGTLHGHMVGELELAAGHPAAANEAIERGLAWSDSSGERFWRPELHRLAAVALSCLGDDDGSVAARVQGCDEAASMGIVVDPNRSGGTGAGDSDGSTSTNSGLGEPDCIDPVVLT